MATEAVKADALGESRKVTFRTAAFTVDSPDDWLMDFMHHSDRDQITLALEAMLGPEQYAEFRALRPRPKMSEVSAFLNSVLSAFGVDPGNSSASTAS